MKSREQRIIALRFERVAKRLEKAHDAMLDGEVDDAQRKLNIATRELLSINSAMENLDGDEKPVEK